MSLRRLTGTLVNKAVMLAMLTGMIIMVTSRTLAQKDACAPNPLSGTISVDTTLCLSSSPYDIVDDVTVDNGVTLTVEAGTRVRFHTPVRGSGKLLINGTLLAQGDMLQAIVFTSGWATPTKADWENIVFGSNSSGSLLEYVTVEYGGSVGPAIEIRSSSMSMGFSTVRNNDQNGMHILNASPAIFNTSFSNNTDEAILIEGDSYPDMSVISASGNGYDGIYVDEATISTDYTWGEAGLSHYRIRSDMSIEEGTTLTVTQGTYVEFRTPVLGDGVLVVDGTLVAQGTSVLPVLFISGWDVQDKGDWEGILFGTSSSNSLLDHAIVFHAGSSDSAVKIATSSVTIQNSDISHNEKDGIIVTTGEPTITHNDIQDNNGFGLRNTSPGEVTQATCNWWGADTGPTHATNPGGSGEEVSNRVIFEPWLTGPAQAGACDGMRSIQVVFLPFVRR
jgi:hypothetical protein